MLKKEQFIKRAKEIHGDKYDYNLVDFNRVIDKVKIICPEHGIFEQTPHKHLLGRGCKPCGYLKVKTKNSSTTEDFVSKAIKIHKDKYNYDKVNYINNHTKVTITCCIHGDFEQIPNAHLQGQGCPKCGNNKVTKLKKENPSGWSCTNWIEASKKSENFDSFKVYILKCTGNNEEFYKIGKTYRTIKDRFRSTILPYDYEILKVFEGEAQEISKLEKKMQKDNKQNKYKPKIKFSGMYECFKTLTNI